MFEGITNFFKRIGKKDQLEASSKDTAKERLHLVLMQDRANVSADFLDMMRKEIIEVIKKYIDVDENDIDVRLTNRTNEDGTTGAPALYANIPIAGIKEEAKNKKTEEGKEEKTEEQKIDEKKVEKEAVEDKKVKDKELENKEEKETKTDETEKKDETVEAENTEKVEKTEKENSPANKSENKEIKDNKVEKKKNNKKNNAGNISKKKNGNSNKQGSKKVKTAKQQKN